MTHTQATITYGHGWLYDGDHVSGGSEGTWTVSGAGASQAVDNGDFLALTRAAADASTVHGTNLSLSTAVYTKIRFRYKCSNASVKAKILVTFTSGTQTVLDETNSTTMAIGAVDLTAAKTINTVTLYATTAAGTVYYDYVLIYKGDFTIPNSAAGVDWLPTPRYAQLQVPSMIGAHTQNLGSVPAEWHLQCDTTISSGNWFRTGDTVAGEVFIDIAHNSATEPWQWFNSGLGQCKVTLDDPIFHRAASGDKLDWPVSLVLREKRLSSAGCSHENYQTRFHLELI